jgi:hypothetical protein
MYDWLCTSTEYINRPHSFLAVYFACNEERHVCEGPVDGIVNQFLSMFFDVNSGSYFSTGILN